jgi:transglutaminase-like putative cysteine protease
MKIDIRYVSSFTYDAEVVDSHNTLRARPASLPHQHVLGYRVTVDPAASVLAYEDYWGTHVDAFSVPTPHTRLTVIAEASVETSPPGRPESPSPWTAGAAPDLDDYLFSTPSSHVTWTSEIADFARDAVLGCEDQVAAALAIHEAVGDHMAYIPGATEVGTSVTEVFTLARGVCQDYAHLALACYRSVGISARYVSGYLYAHDSSRGDAPEEDEIIVDTHAWVEVGIAGHGWWGLDPTNQLAAGERHVKIGHGRDYGDVTPLRGVFHGGASESGLEVTVAMSRRTLPHFSMGPPPDMAELRRREAQRLQQQ